MTVNSSIQLLRSIERQMNGIGSSTTQTVNYMRSLDASAATTATSIQNMATAQSEFFDEMRKSREEANGLGVALKNAFQALGGVESLKSLAMLSDSVTQTTARLGMVNDGQQTDASLTNDVMASAQRSHTDYFQTADAVSKMGLNADGPFQDNGETIAFVEQLNKHFVMMGMSQEDITSATNELAQGLGSAESQGEALLSTFAAAPNLLETVAEYAGLPAEEIRKFAQEGQLSAEYVKNALLSMAGSTDEAFANMPVTWGSHWNTFCNSALEAFQPVLNKLSELANSPQFAQFMQIVTAGMQEIGILAAQAFGALVNGFAFFMDNIAVFGPILATLVEGFAAYTLAVLAKATADNIATVAQNLLTAAIYKCPVFWIAMAFFVLIALIAKAVQYVGGLSNAFVIVRMALNNAKIAFVLFGMCANLVFMKIGDSIVSLGENIHWCFTWVCNAVKGLLLSMVASSISKIQNLLNAFTSVGNQAIRLINKIGNLNIPEIKFTFGDTAMKAVEQSIAQDSAELQALGKQYENNRRMRESQQKTEEFLINIKSFEHFGNGYLLKSAIDSFHASTVPGKGRREDPLANSDYSNYMDLAKEALAGIQNPAAYSAPIMGDDAIGALQDTADNTGDMAESLSINEEDMQYLRDIAEREAINRFTTAEIKLDMTNFNTVKGTSDLDGITRTLADKLREMMYTAAEGSHA